MTRDKQETAIEQFRTLSFVLVGCLFSLIFLIKTKEQAISRLMYSWDWQPNFSLLEHIERYVRENWGSLLAVELPMLVFPVVSLVLLRSAPKGQWSVIAWLTAFTILELSRDPHSMEADLDILAIRWLFAVVTLLVSGLYALGVPRDMAAVSKPST